MVVNTLLGCSASSRHLGSTRRVAGAVGSRTTQVRSSLSLAQHAGGAGSDSALFFMSNCISRFDLQGIGDMHVIFLPGVLVPLTVWSSCHVNVVLVIKMRNFHFPF